MIKDMKPTFDNSVNVLVQAYLKGMLEHGKCSACAVGNIVAAANNTAPARYLWMFNGLMAVVDVLADIHGIDLTQKEQAKLLFVK